MSRRLLPCGEQAVLVELDDLAEVLSLADAVRAATAAGVAAFADVVEVVPAARTLLVVVQDDVGVSLIRRALSELPLSRQPRKSKQSRLGGPGGSGMGAPGEGHCPEIEILVRYDGPDLDEVAALTGMTREQVVAAHTQTPWRVAFTGFAPGFGYLAGGDPSLQVRRRREPRTSVPAGSVGLAGEFSAVYPTSSPGGWQLLGHTEAVLWDADRQPPALLQPGSVVRFVDLESKDDVNDDDVNDDDVNDDDVNDNDVGDNDVGDNDVGDNDVGDNGEVASR